MSRKTRSFLVAALLPAFALTSLCTGASAEAAKAPLAKPTRWSDKATWPNKKVPVAGAKVEIPAGKEVILDVSPPALNGITVMGKLTFADKSDLELTTEWIM